MNAPRLLVFLLIAVIHGAHSVTPSPSNAPTPSPTATSSLSTAASPSTSPTPSMSGSASPSASQAPSASATLVPSSTGSATPTASVSPSPTLAPSSSGSGTPTASVSAPPSTTLVPTSSSSSSSSVTGSASFSPTRTPSATSAATASPTPSATLTASRTFVAAQPQCSSAPGVPLELVACNGSEPVYSAPQTPVESAVVVAAPLLVNGSLVLGENSSVSFSSPNATVSVQGVLVVQGQVTLRVDKPPPTAAPQQWVLFEASDSLNVTQPVNVVTTYTPQRRCQRLQKQEQRTTHTLAITLQTVNDQCHAGATPARWWLALAIALPVAAALVVVVTIGITLLAWRRGQCWHCRNYERPEDGAIRRAAGATRTQQKGPGTASALATRPESDSF